jgi:O-antigen/teichoic acid export membrane protein
LGFDFYTFAARELLRRERSEWGGLLKNQGALALLFYIIFLPLLCIVFDRGLLPWSIAGWFFVLLVLEHLNQELGRLLVAISEPLLASLVLFVRQGTWAIGITVCMALLPATRSLVYVLGAWSVAGLVAFAVGANRVARLELGAWRTRVDWNWIIAGLKISIPFFIATLAIRGIFTLDRYWLQALGGLEVVGAYVLFAGISATLMTFLDAGVFAFSYPGLINAFNQKEPTLFRQRLRNMFALTCVLAAGFSVVSLLLLGPLLSLMKNPVYLAHQDLYPWLLASSVLYALGMIPHFALYAQGWDRPIIASHIASLLVFVAATSIFSAYSPAFAVPAGLCAAFLLILVWKSYAFFRLTPPQYRVATGPIELTRTSL